MTAPEQRISSPDVVLVGSGIMSATLGAMLKVLNPALRIQMFEVTDEPAQESSHGWNNAGTGHAGLCELSYTPHRTAGGGVDVSKAISVFEEFELSRQFWAFAVENGMLPAPAEWIRPVPHLSFVSGQSGVDFLQARYDALKTHPFFREMEFTADPATVAAWAPLLMEGRGPGPVAATRVAAGTDVNFGALARGLVRWLGAQPGCAVATGHRVRSVRAAAGGGWRLRVVARGTGEAFTTEATFVFLGAGGGSLSLLEGTGIAESRGIGGFPIGGQWLVCDNPEIVAQHHAKVYGQALGTAPTLAVPHLDTRMLDGQRVLLFGPFAAWTGKFLHGGGSHLDLLRSVKAHNVLTLTRVGWKNLDLIRYLVEQGTQSKEDRLGSLRDFYPAARGEDWRVVDAGIRVQAIKSSAGVSGIVHYGTEVVTDARHTLAALLGASPGASVSASVALEVVAKCLPDLLRTPALRSVAPTWGVDLGSESNAELYRAVSAHASRVLQLAP